MQANLLHRVAPQYPTPARQMGIQGSVIIKAVISGEGTIEQAQVLSGHPLLISAALNAVRQWKYRPYFLNGQAVDVETEIRVNFILDR
jgi:periplasmic protein TonB